MLVDKLTIELQSLHLLAKAMREADQHKARDLRGRAEMLVAQAEHLERTGHYIELPAHMIDIDLPQA